MDVTGVVQTSVGLENSKLQQEIGVQVLKNTLNFNSDLAMQLIQQLFQANNLTNNPTNTGNFLNIKA